MKRFLAFIGVICLILPVLSGCALYGNDRSNVGLLSAEEKEDTLGLYLSNGLSLGFQREDGVLTLSEEGRPVSSPVASGSTFPRNEVNYAEGYEGLKEEIESLSKDKGRGLYTVFAYRMGESVCGFVNFYRSAVGFLSGGGQISTDKFDCAVLFTYREGDFAPTEFGKLVIAYDGTYAVYFDAQTYYSAAVGTEDEPAAICEDAAFDTGMSHYSYANFSFGDGYIVLYFHNENGSYEFRKNYELYVLARMNGEKLGEYREE